VCSWDADTARAPLYHRAASFRCSGSDLGHQSLHMGADPGAEEKGVMISQIMCMVRRLCCQSLARSCSPQAVQRSRANNPDKPMIVGGKCDAVQCSRGS
jgi:hypothetical protein